MSDGTLSVRRRQPKASEGLADKNSLSTALKTGAYESFFGGLSLGGIGEIHVRDKTKSKPLGDPDEFRVESKRRKKLKEYDKLLKGFKYSAALDSVLRKVILSLEPRDLC